MFCNVKKISAEIVVLRTFHCYLVDVVGVDACVETHVEVVEHLHHLKRIAGRRDGGEAHDVREKNGHLEQSEGEILHLELEMKHHDYLKSSLKMLETDPKARASPTSPETCDKFSFKLSNRSKLVGQESMSLQPVTKLNPHTNNRPE